MSESVADDILRAFFDRWQRLEEEKSTISDDLKELFAEAKSQGFDTKAMRAVFRDKVKDSSEREEAEAIYDLYWESLTRGTRWRTRENIEEFPSQGAAVNGNPEPTDHAVRAGDESTVPHSHSSLLSSSAAETKAEAAPVLPSASATPINSEAA